ncbi:hypothetical protein [Cryobacterium sp. M15]|nr:hypothetical protein [Cryobacterium sp. M15]
MGSPETVAERSPTISRGAAIALRLLAPAAISIALLAPAVLQRRGG